MEDNVPLFIIKCNSCKHYLYNVEGPDCKAFDVIPKKILLGEITHDHIIEGQKGSYVYEPAEE
ncbi:MAG: hypothetical protein PHY29_10475 [Syntrophales bacterium]|nr:hypothetical protein [Syntrophales bacterium]